MPGMVLEEDLYCPKNRLLLLPQGTALNHQNIAKMINHGVSYISSKSGHKTERFQLDDRFLYEELTESRQFKEFDKQYAAYLDTLKIEMNSIINGHELEPQMFSTVVCSLTKKALTKMDLLNYIRYIRQVDDTIFTHSLNVSILCSLAASWFSLTSEEAHYLILSGLLHDIGKILIPSEILNKRGKLTNDEFFIVQRHAQYGYNILTSHDKVPVPVRLPALMHHEKADGTGYPRGIDSRHITKLTSLVSLCDVYEALTADRIYRQRLSPFYVMRQIEMGKCGHIDAAITKHFLKYLSETFIGSTVKLNDAIVGKIIHINPQNVTKPLIQCESGFIDLSTAKNLDITSIA